MNNLKHLLRGQLADRADDIIRGTVIHPELLAEQGVRVSRAVLAQALNLLLLTELLDRVPEALEYFDELLNDKRQLNLDHGALRTVALSEMGSLPGGIEGIARILEPLGFRHVGDYPLDRLRMHGCAYQHIDYPVHIGQFFVSELYPAAFSDHFQQTVATITATSRDPLGTDAKFLLAKLHAQGELTLAEGVALLPELRRCFDRQHRLPTRTEYQTLCEESAEMAWISTEGNAFNHATDRVDDVEAVMAIQRNAGRTAKDKVEVSGSGRVRQSALKAPLVQREMRSDDGTLRSYPVPGSFFEFIARDRYTDVDGTEHLDLRFDSSNAQGIFKMTSVQKSA